MAKVSIFGNTQSSFGFQRNIETLNRGIANRARDLRKCQASDAPQRKPRTMPVQMNNYSVYTLLSRGEKRVWRMEEKQL
jgi:hypothetical protein